MVEPSGDRPRNGGETSDSGVATPADFRMGGVAHAAGILREAGVRVFETCDGTPDPCRHKPFVRFHGAPDEGLRALDIAMNRGVPVDRLNYYYEVNDGTICEPCWELVLLRAVLNRRA